MCCWHAWIWFRLSKAWVLLWVCLCCQPGLEYLWGKWIPFSHWITQWDPESISFENVDYWLIFHYDIYEQYVDMPETVKDLRFYSLQKPTSYFHWRWQKTETPGSETKDFSIQSMSIHVHIVFYCPQRPQNNIGRVRQLLHMESLCFSWGAEFRGKIQSHGLWCATKPFQTWLLCLLLTCSIIGRHYPYRLRLFTIQVSLTKWFRMKVLSELPRKWEKHGSPRGTVPQQGVGMRRSGILFPQLCLGQDGTEMQRRVVSVSWLIE